MKWHIVCLIAILLLAIQPITVASLPPANQGCFNASLAVLVSASHHPIVWGLSWWTSWSTVVWAYGACPGRVTLYRRSPTSARKKRRHQKERSTPAHGHARPMPASGKTAAQPVTETEPPGEASVASEDSGHISLRMVLRPGVILTKRGIQLRPIIARLGQTVAEYRTSWNDKEQFKAAIEPSLHRSCPRCGGQSGFRCVGSDKRSVIPPGRKERVWFRVQKVECRDCGAKTRILPTFCIPFKSHHAQTIQNVLENCWRRNTSYRDTTAILNQSRPADG